MSTDTTSLETATAGFEALLSDSPGATEAEHEDTAEDTAEADEAEAHDEDDSEGDAEADASTEEESDDEAADGGDGEDEDLEVTVKIDGKSTKVKLSELKSGYQMGKSYTQKSQALAEERKAFLADQEAIKTERAQYAHMLGVMAQQVNQVQEPDWNALYQTDPQRYLLARDQWAQLKEREAAIRAEQDRVAYDTQVQQVREFQAKVQSERELLLEKHPEFKDPAVLAKAQKEIRKYGREVMKFTEDELNGASDHRAVSALYTAMKAHKIANTKGVPAKSSAARVPVGSVSSTPRKPNAFENATKRLKSTGSISDAAEAFRHLL